MKKFVIYFISLIVIFSFQLRAFAEPIKIENNSHNFFHTLAEDNNNFLAQNSTVIFSAVSVITVVAELLIGTNIVMNWGNNFSGNFFNGVNSFFHSIPVLLLIALDLIITPILLFVFGEWQAGLITIAAEIIYFPVYIVITLLTNNGVSPEPVRPEEQAAELSQRFSFNFKKDSQLISLKYNMVAF